MHRYTPLGFFLLLLATSADGNILKLNAQKVYYQNSTLVAEGNVTLHYKDFLLKTQKLVYNRKSQTVDLKGKVFITNNKTIFIIAEDGKYNLANGEIILNNPKGKVDNYVFYATFAKFANGTLLAKYVCASKCADFQAEVCAKKFIFFTKEKEGVAYKGLVKVEKVPILYTPFYYFTTKRKSGILPPTLGFDSYSEFIYQQPLYLVTGKYSDITLTPDYRTGGLKGLGFELRKYFSHKFYLQLNNYFYYDTAYPNLWWKGRNYYRKHRFIFSGEGFNGNLSFKWEYPSDKDVYYDIFFNQDSLKYKSFAESFIDYLLESKSFILNLRTVYFYNLLSSDRKVDLALAPDILVYKKPTKLIGNTSWDFTTELTNFYRYDSSFVRLRLESSLRWGKVFGTTPVEMELKPFINYYSSKRYGNVKAFGGVEYRLSSLIYDFNLVRTSNYLWQSVVETQYKLQPFKEKKTPYFDYFDEFAQKNMVVLRNLNNLFYKDLKIAEISLEQPYNFYRGYNFPTDGYFISKHLMPLKLSYDLGNRKFFITLNGQIYYDYYLKSIAYQSNTLNFYPIDTDDTNLLFRIGYTLSKDHLGQRYTDQYKFGFSGNYKHIYISGDYLYDRILNKPTLQKFSLEFKKQCWSISLNYERDYNRDSDSYNWRVFLTFSVFGKALNALLAGGRQ